MILSHVADRATIPFAMPDGLFSGLDQRKQEALRNMCRMAIAPSIATKENSLNDG